MPREADTHIRVTKETWMRLNERKEPGDSFEDVIQRLIAEADSRSGEDAEGNPPPATTAD